MLFNSYGFILFFLPFVFLVYFKLNQLRLIVASRAFLVFSSLFFYSWWDISYLPLILSSMLFNFVLGSMLGQDANKRVSKKSILIVGITCNLVLLGYFKYSDFFIFNYNEAFNADISSLNLVLPLAISFYTFQQIAYLVDSYRGGTKEYDFLNYAVFVTFFPQLIAGPIVHHSEMMPQFIGMRNKIKNYRNIVVGMFIFSIGLFKKVVIADSFAMIATPGFDVSESLTLLEAWGTSLSYTFQLYFDFCGYTDMAIGIALLFNIKLPVNFNYPYKSTNIQEFWRRWHITLSRFLRDYVYIPLGGNRNGGFKTYNNLLMTFLLGGLWHGAGWTFVFWGLLHGLALMAHRAWSRTGFVMNSIVAWFITMNFVNIAWVFFRAKEFQDAIKVLKGMFGFSGVEFSGVPYLRGMEFVLPLDWIIVSNPITTIIVLVIFMIIVLVEDKIFILFMKYNNKRIFYLAIFLLVLIPLVNLRQASEFLYFQF